MLVLVSLREIFMAQSSFHHTHLVDTILTAKRLDASTQVLDNAGVLNTYDRVLRNGDERSS
jgi:hypothetical protein